MSNPTTNVAMTSTLPGTRAPIVPSSAIPTIVSSSTGTNPLAGGTTVSVTAPANIASGNLLLAIGSSGTETWTPPSGWTLYNTKAASGNSPQISIFTKTATGSEPGSYSWTTNNGATDATNMIIFNISGANTSSPINGTFANCAKYTSTAATTIGASGNSISTVLNSLPIAISAIQQLNPSNTGNPTSLTGGWTGEALVVNQDSGNFGNVGNNNGYNACYTAAGPLTTSTSVAVTAGWTWGGASSNFTGTSVMLFVTP